MTSKFIGMNPGGLVFFTDPAGLVQSHPGISPRSDFDSSNLGPGSEADLGSNSDADSIEVRKRGIVFD